MAYHLFLFLEIYVFKQGNIYFFSQFSLIGMHFAKSSVFFSLSFLFLLYQVRQNFEEHDLTIAEPELVWYEHSFLMDVVLEAEEDALLEEHASEFLLAG